MREKVADPDGSISHDVISSNDLSWPVRIAAIVVGVLAATGGTVAVFVSDNEAGTAALFLLAAAFLGCGIFDLLPSGINLGGAGMRLTARAALATVERLATDADPDVRERAASAFGDELEERGLALPADAQAERVISGFVRAGSLDAQAVADRLAATGWQAMSPAKARYVRWTYEGSGGATASIFQNVGNLAVNRRNQMEVVQGLDGATPAPNKDEIRFPYVAGIENALAAADRLQQFVGRS